MTTQTTPDVAVIGGGPAGLIAAEVLAAAGVTVSVFDQKPSVGRKFLMAGRGGLNLTHSEEREQFLSRYGDAAGFMAPLLENFSPDDLRNWCRTIGEETFVGTSGRVFPHSFKASPLLRRWLKRLEGLAVSFCPSHRWVGWNRIGRLMFATGEEGSERSLRPKATLLALGGASWPRLGSDGAWVPLLEEKGISVTPLRPSNCGFLVGWSDIFKEKFAGVPLKPVGLQFGTHHLTGEAMISRTGIEGGAIYALSSVLREEIEKEGQAVLHLDLRPGMTEGDLCHRLQAPRARLSFSNFMRKYSGLSAAAISLLREGAGGESVSRLSATQLAARIKSFPLQILRTVSLERAISTAGGVARDELTEGLMLKKLPGVYVAGEMLDWESPTGGYLLQGCFSTGVWAAQTILKQLGL